MGKRDSSTIQDTMGCAEHTMLEGKFLWSEKSLELRKLDRDLESKYNCPVDNHPLVSAKRNELLRKQESEDETDKKHKLPLDFYPVKEDGPVKKRSRKDIDCYHAETESDTNSVADAMIVTDPEDSDDDSETLVIAEDDKSFKKLSKVVVQKDIEKVTPVLNDLLLVKCSDVLAKKEH